MKKIDSYGDEFKKQLADMKFGQKTRVDKIEIEPRYQRVFRKNHADDILKKNDGIIVEALQPLLVGLRSNGDLMCVDGQHRLAVLKKLGVPSYPCDIFNSRGKAHEAQVFRVCNKNRRGINPCEMFRACLEEGDPQSVAINKILKKYGLKIGGQLKAVRAIQQIYEMDNGYILDDTLSSIMDGWEGFPDSDRFKEVCLYGAAKTIQALFSEGLWNDTGRSELVSKMTAVSNTPRLVLDRYRAQKTTSGWKRPEAALRAFADVWNHNRRVNKLVL